MAERDKYDRALQFTLAWEGGWVNDPDDYPTKHGVRQRTYDNYRARCGRHLQSVRHLRRYEMEDIYFTEYWLASHCDLLPSKFDMVVFDMAVHSGDYTARIYLQKVLGVVQDGVVGPKTRGALHAVLLNVGGYERLIKRYCRKRRTRFFGIVVRHPTKVKYLNGWVRRVRALRRCALDKPRWPGDTYGP